jgi:hypothetical protein
MIKIFIVTHKEKPLLSNDLLIPIQVGNLETIEDKILRDNTEDNIAIKNPNYCELTALYWIWKNCTVMDIVGICHYRRYFNFYNPIYNLKPSAQKKISVVDFYKTKTFQVDKNTLEKKITSLLNKYDIILTKPYHFKKSTISENYFEKHRKNDWDITMEIIKEKYPEYQQSITSFLDNGRIFHFGNMMICTTEKFDNYNQWLFSILFELEKRINIPEDQYQARVFGFISERLINLYVYHNKFKIKEIPTYKIIDI